MLFLAGSENQGYSFQVVQPLPLPAPGSADLLGRGRHRGSPPSIHAWLRLPAQLSHAGGKAFPLPAETLRSKVMSSPSPVLLHKDLNLCLDITCFCSPLPALRLFQFHPCVLFFLLKLPVLLLSAIFGLVPLSLYFSTPFPFPPSHSSSFAYLNLHEHWFFFGVVGCSLGAALSTPLIQGTLYVASKQKQTSHRSSRWFSDGHVSPCFHKERIVEDCNVSGFLEQLNTIFWQRDRCEYCWNTCMSKENKTNNICQITRCRYYDFNCLSFFAGLLKMFWCNLLGRPLVES